MLVLFHEQPPLVPAISHFPICFNYECKILFYFFNSIQIIFLNRQIVDEGYHSSRSLHQVSSYRPYCKVIRIGKRVQPDISKARQQVNIDRPACNKTDKQCRTRTTITARLPDG